MVAARAGKRAAVDSSNSLSDGGILKQVLSYAGAGEFIFYAPISKLWLECYRGVPPHRVKKKTIFGKEQIVDVLPHMTLRRAVFSSAARVKLAHTLGLQFGIETKEQRFYIGSVACEAVLMEAHRLGMRFSTDVLNGAASVGELSTVIWLYTEHNCALNSTTSDWCAKGGHINVLWWLKQQGTDFDAKTMSSAAMNGQESTCAYLHSEGCSWDAFSPYAAAVGKHWGTVRWLHEHGCPWSFVMSCLAAAEQGSIDNMAYMLQQGVVCAYVLSEMLNSAGANGHLAAAQWVRQRGAEWPRILRFSAVSWSGDVLDWARTEGCDSPLNYPAQAD
jgi:hypothetical protein